MNKDFYVRTREKVAQALNDSELMILFAGKDICQSEDEAYKFTINRNFYYLTGINEQNDIFVMVKENGKVENYLFINPYDEYQAKWYGKKLLKDEAMNLSGIENILYLEDFASKVNTYLTKGFKVYMDIKACLFAEPYGQAKRYSEVLKEKGYEVKDCHALIAKFRMEKEPEELETMKKAIHITRLGIEALMENVKPGLIEGQVESYFDQKIKYHGASGFAFKTIAASGKNGCVLHYSANNTRINDNELILFDLGAEYDLYKSDISRTIPANGKFTPRQKEIYNIVLRGQELVFKTIKPGLTTRDLNNVLIDYYVKELTRIGLIKTPDEVKKYYFHGVSHHLGLDTHDVNTGIVPLTPGCVITVEPGLYISEEGIGIRIEDDALVTEDGAINLSQEIIKKPEEIEAFMAKYNK